VTAKSPLDLSRGNRTRIGALGFPISGLVAASAALVPGIGVNPAVYPAGFAQAANYVGLANLAGLVSLVLLLFSFQALHAFLERNSIDRWAFAGMVLSVIGLCAFFSFLGIFAFAGPVAGKFYLGGDLKAASIISESTGISNPAALAFGGVSGPIFGSWGNSLLGRHLAIRQVPEMVCFRLCSFRSLELDSALRSCSLAIGWNTPFRNWNCTRKLENSKRRTASNQIGQVLRPVTYRDDQVLLRDRASLP